MHPGRLIMEVNIVYNDISDNFYFEYKAVQFDYKAVLYFRWKYPKRSWFFSFFMSFLQNLPDFSMFRKNYDDLFEFYRKRAFIWYKNTSSSIIFSQYHELNSLVHVRMHLVRSKKYVIFNPTKNILPVNGFQKKLNIMFLMYCLIDGANSNLLLICSRFAYFFP